jgi:hypothetical protein
LTNAEVESAVGTAVVEGTAAVSLVAAAVVVGIVNGIVAVSAVAAGAAAESDVLGA